MAAKTSLARQLELLKLPQTSAHKETHGSASFLYDFLEANTIDADTHFSLALSGLEGIIKIDPYVETFKETLFHESSKKFDRGVETKESNNKIDVIIEEFLFRVASKYFQLSDTHKTIEWLIYRYKINEYNMNALIGSVLPYHETRQFVRLLQTCSAVKNPRNSQWYWLKNIQESGVPLAKSLLLQHCISSVEFIRFITDSVFKSLQIDPENSLFSSFLVSFCLNLLERTTSEDTINMIVSALSKAIRMKTQSLYIASYMIFAHLCSVTKLNSQEVHKMLRLFARKIKPEVFEGAFLSFNIVCYTQDVDILPLEFLKENLITNLANYSNVHNFEYLIKCMLLSIVCLSHENLSQDTLEVYKQYFQKLFGINKGLTEATVVSVIVAVDSILEKRTSSNISEVGELYSYIVGLAEKQFPTWFDNAINSLKSLENISSLLKSVRYSFVTGTNVPLFLGLDHSSKRIRRQSMLHFAKNFNTFLNDQNDANIQYLKQVIKSNLLSDLNNANSDILIEIFSIKEKVFNLFTLTEFEKIALQIINICNRHELEEIRDHSEVDSREQSANWSELKQLLLQIYYSKSFEDYHCGQDKALSVVNSLFFGDEHSLRLINYLFPTNDKQLAHLALILNSNYAKTNPLFISILKEPKLKKLLSVPTLDSSHLISKNILKYIVQFCSDNLQTLMDDSNFHRFLEKIQLDNCVLERRTSILLIFILTEVYRNRAELKVDNCRTLGKVMINLLLIQLTYLKLSTRSSVKVVELAQYDELDISELFFSQLNLLDGCSIPNFLVEYVLYSLIGSIDSTLIDNHDNNIAVNWQLVDNEDELFYFNLYHLLLYYASPTNNKHVQKKGSKTFRNLLTFFLRKLIMPVSSNHKNEIAFKFFLPVISNSSNIYLRMLTLSLMNNLLQIPEISAHLIASLQAHSQYIISYMVALSSPFVACRQLVLANLKTIQSQIDSRTNLYKFIHIIIESEEDILTNDQNIYKVLSNACAKSSLAVQLMEDILVLLTGPFASKLSLNLRISLLNLLLFSKVDMKLTLFEYYFFKFFSSDVDPARIFPPDQEIELKTLVVFFHHDQEKIFQLLEDRPNYICQFYLALIESSQRNISQQLALVVFEVLHRELINQIRSTNEDFAIQLVSTLLKVQLNLSENGPGLSKTNNLTLINSIRKRLRRINKDGTLILHVLQHLMPVEEIYDTFTYAKKEASTEKRSRRLGTENDSKFATGWKLLRIYVGSFQNTDEIEKSAQLVKTLFDYLKLTFMEVDDNSNEYTRQTILYAIANCIEAKLSKKSVALKQGKSRTSIEENEDGVDRMEVDNVENNLELTELLNNINVDNIVDCMRESRLKETQKVALLLISLIAPYFQKQILDYLVAIFTFIGTSLLQCDDQYSLAILFETMESIIPIILQNDTTDSTNQVRENLDETDMKQYIISIFVKSFSDIPSYRRLPLFTKLVQLLGEDRFLCVLCVRLLEEASIKKSKTEKELLFVFLQALFSEFSSNVELTSLCTLMCLFERKFFDHHLKKKSLQKHLIEDRIVKQFQEESNLALLSLKTLSESVCRDFSTKIVYDSDKLGCGVEILRFIVLVISNTEFIENSVQLADGPFSYLLIHFLNLLLELIVSLGPGDSSMKPGLNLYRKRIKSTLDEILLKYNSLLPSEKLIEIVIVDLLNNSAQVEPYLSSLIKRKALELLNEKLMKLGPKELKKTLPIKIIKSLDKHLPNEEEQISKLDDIHIHNIQLMMLSLKFATKFDLFNEDGGTSTKTANCLSDAFQHIYKLANTIVISRKTDEDISARAKSLQNLKGSCILCLTQILCTMSLEGIRYLSDAVGLILRNFEVNDDIILISNVSSLSKLIAKFAQFLSPHLKSIILKLLYAYTWCSKISNLRSKLQINWTNLAKLVPKRVIFEAIDASYEEATAISPQSVMELMSLFKMSCDNLEKSDVEVIVKSFKNFMIKALSYRSIHHKDVSLITIEHIEASFGEAFSAFIPKLTEASFRPIFYKLLEWAIQIENFKKVNNEDKSYFLHDLYYFRMIAFYRFCSLLADRLKSLFCIFVAPSIINNCSEMLLAYHSTNFEEQLEDEYGEFITTEQQSSKSREGKLKLSDSILGEPLIAAILATLSKCFLYDLNGTFVNKDCTTLIVKPIVNQISNLFGSDTDFETRLDLILQCTQYLIQNNKDETLIKEFNYQILLKTRETSEKIRVGAIKVLHRLILTCSEDYLPFIPEAIPFIAELSEEESELVEGHVKKLIIDIEQLVGEPINKYL